MMVLNTAEEVNAVVSEMQSRKQFSVNYIILHCARCIFMK